MLDFVYYIMGLGRWAAVIWEEVSHKALVTVVVATAAAALVLPQLYTAVVARAGDCVYGCTTVPILVAVPTS